MADDDGARKRRGTLILDQVTDEEGARPRRETLVLEQVTDEALRQDELRPDQLAEVPDQHDAAQPVSGPTVVHEQERTLVLDESGVSVDEVDDGDVEVDSEVDTPPRAPFLWTADDGAPTSSMFFGLGPRPVIHELDEPTRVEIEMQAGMEDTSPSLRQPLSDDEEAPRAVRPLGRLGRDGMSLSLDYSQAGGFAADPRVLYGDEPSLSLGVVVDDDDLSESERPPPLPMEFAQVEAVPMTAMVDTEPASTARRAPGARHDAPLVGVAEGGLNEAHRLEAWLQGQASQPVFTPTRPVVFDRDDAKLDQEPASLELPPQSTTAIHDTAPTTAPTAYPLHGQRSEADRLEQWLNRVSPDSEPPATAAFASPHHHGEALPFAGGAPAAAGRDERVHLHELRSAAGPLFEPVPETSAFGAAVLPAMARGLPDDAPHPPAMLASPEDDESPVLSVSVFARIKNAVWRDGTPLAEALEKFGVDPTEWYANERRQAGLLNAQADAGATDLAGRLRAALGDAPGDHEDLMSLSGYAALRAAVEVGTDPGEIFKERGIDEEQWERIRGEWAVRARRDAAVAKQVRRALTAARRKLKEPP